MKLVVEHLGKEIKGKEILRDINCEFESGKIYGIVGRNGSGKTMLLRAISGLMRCQMGAVYLDGKKLGRDMKILPGVGLMIENTEMYPEFTGYRNLKMLADIQGKIGKQEIQAAIGRVGLDGQEKKIVKKYSMGMRQKLAIAQAIMERPDILLLDEPTNGLDEVSVKMFRDIMQEEKARGALILLASHNKEDILQLSDEVFQMAGGEMRKEEVSYEI